MPYTTTLCAVSFPLPWFFMSNGDMNVFRQILKVALGFVSKSYRVPMETNQIPWNIQHLSNAYAWKSDTKTFEGLETFSGVKKDFFLPFFPMWVSRKLCQMWASTVVLACENNLAWPIVKNHLLKHPMCYSKGLENWNTLCSMTWVITVSGITFFDPRGHCLECPLAIRVIRKTGFVLMIMYANPVLHWHSFTSSVPEMDIAAAHWKSKVC